jgi:uncharacterized protein
MGDQQMEGTVLRLYLHENQQVRGQTAWEWLLKTARKSGIDGGSAFRAVAGFGRHHIMHEDSFLNVLGTGVVMVELFTTEEKLEPLLARVSEENISAFYLCSRASYGFTGTVKR